MIMEKDVIEMIKEAIQVQVQPLIDRLDQLAEGQDAIKIAQEIQNPPEPKEPKVPQDSKIGRFPMSEVRTLRDTRKAQEKSHIQTAIRGLDGEQTSTTIKGLKK